MDLNYSNPNLEDNDFPQITGGKILMLKVAWKNIHILVWIEFFFIFPFFYFLFF